MKLAFVHDWLTAYGGAERVLETLHSLYPEAPIFTTIYNKDKLPQFASADIRTSAFDKISYAKNHHQIFIPLMPYAVEHYDLKEFDIVFSDSSACAKGAIKRPGATHICYCHTPLRYVWEPEIDPRASSSWLRRWAANRLKKWDLATINRVDKWLANSHYVKNRIQKFYNRDAEVIYPPVDTNKWQPVKKPDNYFVYVSRLVDYKRPDIIVAAFNKLGLPLKIVGTGPEMENLRKMAKSNIEFLGRVSDKELQEIYPRALAFVYASIEDCGIVPVEAMAAGRPVITIGQGGAAETVIKGVTGLHYSTLTSEAIVEAVHNFRPEKFDSKIIRAHAEKFDTEVFKRQIKNVIDNAYEKATNNS